MWRGWYPGDPEFRDRATALFDKPGSKRTKAAGAHQGHGEADAERLAAEALAALELPSDRTSLGNLKKGKRGKVLVAGAAERADGGGKRLDHRAAFDGSSWLGEPSRGGGGQ